MINRNKLGGRRVGMRGRLAIAAAVLVGGGAAGVIAVAASNGGPTTAQSAGYTMRYQHRLSERQALTSAFNGWGRSQHRSLRMLSEMRPMHTFSQFREHHHAMFAVQRGIVVLATRRFIVVRSANGSLHLWWLTRHTGFKNVSATATGMNALTGNGHATTEAMVNGNMTPATNLLAGSMGMMRQMTTPTARTATVTINSGGQVITITVTRSAAMVTQPMTTRSFRSFRTFQSAFRTTRGVMRGDLAFVAGVRRHGSLFAKIVLFAAPTTTMPSPTATPTTTVPPSTTQNVNTQVTPVGNGAPTFTGSHS